MMRYLLPLGVAIALVVVLAWGLTRDPEKVPSPLIGKSVPTFELTTVVDADARFTAERFGDHEVSLFNVWASWCVACRHEHGLLMRVAEQGDVPIYGLNYKDRRSDARAWLSRRGNPYEASAFDPDGQVGMDWGVYGVPETFVVDDSGTIRYKHVGPITEQAWRETIQPIVERVRGASG